MPLCLGVSQILEKEFVLTLDDRHDGALLDGRRALKTISIDTTKELSSKVHGIKGIGCLIVV